MVYDVIIVGGGTAGCVLAGRLAENPNISVLLLEAGNDYPDLATLPDDVKYGNTRHAEALDSRHNWSLIGTATEEQGEVHVAQGKVIGGGSSINGQSLQRGFPEDFDLWESLGNDEWSYDKVLPFYKKMETDLDIRDDYHGTDGPMPVRRRQSAAWADLQRAFYDACLQAGFGTSDDTNGPNPAGVGVGPTNTGDHEIRMSAAITHLNPMRHRVNLTVRGNVYVRRVLFEGARAVGLEAESGGEVFTLRGERIVLAAGAVRSPQLLMLSGVGPKDQLDQYGIPVVHEVPGVGHGLWNHLTSQITFKVKDGKTVISGLDAPHFSLHFTSPGSSMSNDMSMRPGPVIDERRERVGGVRTTYMTGDVPPERAARLQCMLTLPEGSGYVKLVSADPGAQPEFNYCYLQHPSDMRRVREGVRFGISLLESDGFKEVFDYVISPTEDILNDDDALDYWIRQTIATSRHLAGTCKMGPDSDDMAVVDQYCQVKGVEKLWVADASVTPRLLRSGGLFATVIMIGERVVDWIAAG